MNCYHCKIEFASDMSVFECDEGKPYCICCINEAFPIKEKIRLSFKQYQTIHAHTRKMLAKLELYASVRKNIAELRGQISEEGIGELFVAEFGEDALNLMDSLTKMMTDSQAADIQMPELPIPNPDVKTTK